MVINANKAQDHFNDIKMQHSEILSGIQEHALRVAGYKSEQDANKKIADQESKAAKQESDKANLEGQAKILEQQNKQQELAIKQAALSI